MIPMAPSEVAASVNFAFVDIVNMEVAIERQLQLQVCGKEQVSVAYRKARLGPTIWTWR